jgi:hypothetical protein
MTATAGERSLAGEVCPGAAGRDAFDATAVGLGAQNPAFNARPPATTTAIFPRHFMVSIYR